MSTIRLLPAICLGLFCLTLGKVSAVPASPPPPLIKVGGSIDALHDSSVTDAEISFKLIFNELLADTKEHFTIKIYNSTDDLIEDFKSGKLEGVFLSSLRFLELDDMVHPTGRYVVQYGPSVKQRYLILVRRHQETDSLAQLRGRKLSLAASDTVGRRFLDVTLLEQGLPESDRFFSEIERVKEVNTAVIDLFFGKVDVALVPEHSYELACELNPQVRASLSVLASSEPMLDQAVGMRYDFPQQRLDRIEPHILQLSPSKRLGHLFETFRIHGLHRLNDNTLKEVRELNERYHRLSHQTP
ncbi:MAG: PhnD/SsuA/transferrin family substrate-binding protein [Candidatus Thiodiazotropha sp.]